MKKECLDIIQFLDTCPPSEWAYHFVHFKMVFWRKYCNGLIFSIIHGCDFFHNIVKCLEGEKWEPDKDEEEPGEYEENFRKFIKKYESI